MDEPGQVGQSGQNKPEWLKGPVVAGAVLGLVLGLLIGMAAAGRGNRGYQGNRGGVGKAETQTNKVVKFVSKNATGTVSAITGQQLTISDQGDSIIVMVADNALVEKVTEIEPQAGSTNPPPPPQRTRISFSDVKVGDFVKVLLSSQPDGSFKATSVTVSETR